VEQLLDKRVVLLVLALLMSGQARRTLPAQANGPGPEAFGSGVAVTAVRAEIEELISKSGADAAVAFRTLDGRDELLIQPEVEYHAASTMKVSVLIELFRQAHAGLLKLDDQIPVVNEFHSIVDGSRFSLEIGADSDAEVYKHAGGRMSFRDLAEAMITVSSNFAANLLIQHLGPENIQRTTEALGAPGMRVRRGVEDGKAFESGLNNTTTASALLTLMEKIAKGEAVDKAGSAEMVAILKRQRFRDRIPAGLPPDIEVAHKTGEITGIQHDAAIVYAVRPFTLVILVRGLQDPKQGARLAADITRTLYAASQNRPAESRAPQENRASLSGEPTRSAEIAAPAPVTQPSSPGGINATAQLLTELIRVDNSNPPGHEGQLDALLAAKLGPLGFEIEIVPTPDAGKSHMLARLRGDGSRKPILLASHADTVGVERDKWSVDPFAGVIKDGHVYGRGAIDFKGGVAVFARAVMMLAENKVPLARDVIFLVEADEEGARYHTNWLAGTHWAKMDCEFALNEGGWIIKDEAGTVKYVSISTADKGSVAVLITARGTSTHSSMPRPDNAIFALSKALARLADYETTIQLIPSTKKFFLTLARTSTPPMSDYFRTIATSTDAAALAKADREVSRDPLMHSLMRNTIAPVLMNAGFRGNVIPGSAEATINVRTIPGTDPADIVREFQRVIADPRIAVTLAPGGGLAASEPSSEDTELFRALDRQARAVFPGAEVTPYLFQAGTDAGAWRSRGIPVYGIYPYPITADELTRMHGNDERVSVDALAQGTELLYKTLVEVAGKR
jgi:acetylornithine deacetylase/succinyl-diaminopimelate desuccinylase-like protein/beta-lactamase class A